MRSSLVVVVLLSGCNESGLNQVPKGVDTAVGHDSDTVETDTTDTDTVTAAGCEVPSFPGEAIGLEDACIEEPAEVPLSARVEWNAPNCPLNISWPSNAMPVVGQVTDDDGDGVPDSDDTPDVFLACDQYGILYDGATGAVHWTTRRGPELVDYAAGALGDLDGDGWPEVVVMSHYTSVYAFDGRTGALVWESETFETYVDTMQNQQIVISDMDHDGSPEVVAGRVILRADGSTRGIGELGFGCNIASLTGDIEDGAGSVVVADLDGDGVEEVVTGNAAYDPDGNLLWANDMQDGVPTVVDFDVDLEPEIVAVSGNHLWAMETDGTVVWHEVLGSNDWNSNGPAAADDLDGDGYPEIVITADDRVQAWRFDGTLVWEVSSGKQSLAVEPTIFDFDGDGYPEVVVPENDGLTILRGTDGSVRLKAPYDSPYSIALAVSIADVDGDGAAELLVPRGDPYATTPLTVFGSDGDPWPRAREVWNQDAYFVTNVEEDGGIPTTALGTWQATNTFRSARLSAGPQMPPELRPAVLDVCADECGDDRLLVTWRVENAGGSDVGSPIQVTLHVGDVAGPLLATEVLATGISAGTASPSYTSVVSAAALGGQGVVVVVDEEARFAECSEEDNMSEVTPGCP